LKALCLGTLLIALCALLALLDGESGLGIWHELRVDLEASRARVEDLVAENEALRREIALLEADPTAMDRMIREELDMALPGEVVVHFFAAGGFE
jgi:cell division protein FtsB